MRKKYPYQYRYRGDKEPPKVLFLLIALVLVAGAVFAVDWLLSDGAPPEDPPPAAVQPPGPGHTSEEPEDPSPPSLPKPEAVRGIYITGPVAGDSYLDTLITLIDETELNAVVIDVKNDEGRLTYRPGPDTAVEIGACVGYIQDLPGLVAKLKDHQIYTIARIAAFKDPVLAKARPELALRYKNGSPVAEGGGPAWVNPYEPQVWSYLEEIALDAAEAGFDEVQFDYVRFPTGRSMDQVDYGPSAGDRSKSDAIAGFLESAAASLHAQQVLVSADVFGTVIDSSTDAQLIGQDYLRLAEIVDCICPMVYPSHYASGAFGLEVPDAAPYDTVLGALRRSGTALSQAEKEVRVRAWLQDFTATWVPGHLDYGAEELRAQINAVYSAGYTDWLLWNGKNQYTAEGLLPAE